MSDRMCSIDGCPGKVLARAWCRNHYYAWKRNGDPLAAKRVYRFDHDTAAAFMRAAGLEPLVPYPGKSNVPWLCRCLTCGAEVSPRLHSIRAGQGGCRRCADRRTGQRQRGAGNPYWRGDQAGYFAVHRRLLAQRGKASEHPCVDCGEQAQEWSYDGGSAGEQVGTEPGAEGLKYTTDLTTYSPRCTKCHSDVDGRGKYPRSKGGQ